MFIFKEKRDKQRFDIMCRFILSNMLLPQYDSKLSYVSVGCNKAYAVAWIQQLKSILWHCTVYLKHLKPEQPQDHKAMMLYLNMLLTMTSCSTWRLYEPLRPAMNQLCVNTTSTLVARGLLASLQTVLLRGLCRTRPSLKKAELTAIVSIAFRYVIYCQFSESAINLFLMHILSVPALIRHISISSVDILKIFTSKKNTLFGDALSFLIYEQNARILFNVLEGNYGLCLLANIIHLAHLDPVILNERMMDFVVRFCSHQDLAYVLTIWTIFTFRRLYKDF